MNQEERKAHLDETAAQVFGDLADTPGAAIAVDPDIADHMGAFIEDALTPEEAEESSFDEEVVNE